MKSLKRAAALVCTVVLLGTLGCSDDSDGNMMNATVSPAAAQTAAQNAAVNIGLPMNALVNALVQLLSQVPRGLPTIQCDSGSAFVDSQGANFQSCVIDGTSIDGTIDYDTQTFALDFNVTVDGASVVGPGMFLPSVTCGPGVSFLPGFQVDGVDVVGTLEICDVGRGVISGLPIGDLTVTFADPPIIVELDFDGGSVVQITIRDLTGSLLFNCVLNLLKPPLTAQCA